MCKINSLKKDVVISLKKDVVELQDTLQGSVLPLTYMSYQLKVDAPYISGIIVYTFGLEKNSVQFYVSQLVFFQI